MTARVGKAYISETDRSAILERAAAKPRERKVLYLDSGDERLERRYMEPRWPTLSPRPSNHGWGPVRARSVFWPCATADLVIDTSAPPASNLMRPLTARFALDALSLRVFATSLARRHGILGLPI
jgi:hypothetical protein